MMHYEYFLNIFKCGFNALRILGLSVTHSTSSYIVLSHLHMLNHAQ